MTRKFISILSVNFLILLIPSSAISQSLISDKFESLSGRPLSGYSQPSLIPFGGGGYLPAGPGSLGGSAREMARPSMPSMSSQGSMNPQGSNLGRNIGVLGMEPLRSGLGAGGQPLMMKPSAPMRGSPAMNLRKPVGSFPFARPTPLPGSTNSGPSMSM